VGAGIACAALVALVLVALGVGRFAISPAEVGRLLWSAVTGTPSELPEAMVTVLFRVRGPRILTALVVGAALAAAGAAYQGLFRNPVVSPDILGASAGAALGAVLGIYGSLGVAGIQALAFATGLVAVASTYAIGAWLRHPDPVLVLVLAGIVMGTLFGSGVALMKYLADPYNQLPAMTFWLLGSLAGVTLADLAAIAPAVLVGLVPLVLLRWRMNVMTLGEDEARALGVDTRRMRLAVVAAATLMTAAVVSVSGVIGWIGLLVPHLARFLVSADFRRLLPVAMVLGAAYLLGIDTLARTMAGIEIPSACSPPSWEPLSSSGCWPPRGARHDPRAPRARLRLSRPPDRARRRVPRGAG
jgi:iron complex transport system permease protein